MALPQSEGELAAFVQRILDSSPQAAVQVQQAAVGGAQPGDIIVSAAATRAGALLCDGAAYSRTGFAALFAKIGTTYGAGDGSTTFNVPDMKGRSPLGAGLGDAAGAILHALGSKAGEETHLLTVAEMPSHNHNVPVVNEVSGFWGDANYDHAMNGGGNNNGVDPNVNTSAQGGGGRHNILSPSTVVNFFIKT